MKATNSKRIPSVLNKCLPKTTAQFAALLAFVLGVTTLPAVAGPINWNGQDVNNSPNGVGNFSYCDNWYGSSCPTSFSGWVFGNDLHFSYNQFPSSSANAHESAMTNDYTSWQSIGNIYWDSTFSSALTNNGVPTMELYYGNGNAGTAGLNFDGKIENDWAGTIILNMQTSGAWNSGDTYIQLNPVGGSLTLLQPVFNDNAQPYQVWGGNTNTLTVGADLVGGVSGKSGVSMTIEQYSIVNFTNAQTWGGSSSLTVSNGELWVGAGGNLVVPTVNMSALSGNGVALSKFWLPAAAGGTTVTNAIVVNPGGTDVLGGLNTSGTNTFSGNVTVNGPVQLVAYNPGGTVQFSGAISGGSGVTAGAGTGGTGTVMLSGTDTYTGPTTISTGTLTIGGAGKLGSGSYSALITNNSALNYASSANQTLSGVISGTGALTNSGSSTLTLSGANTYTGGTAITAGTVAITLTGGLGSGGTVTLGNSSGAAATVAVGGASGSNAANLTNAVTVAGTGLNTISGTWNNSGQINLLPGAITLSSANLTINATAASGWRIQGGVTGTGGLTFQDNYTGSGAVIDIRSTLNNTGYITNSGTGSVALNENGGSGGLIGANVTGLVQNSATSPFTLNAGNSSFAGTAQVLAGTMALQNASALNMNNTVSVASGATLDIQNVSETLAGLNDVSGVGGTVTDSTGTAVRTLTLGGNGNYSSSSLITAATPADMAVTKSGTGTQTLSGASTYSGGTTLSVGQLNINNGGSSAANSAIGIGTFTITGGTIDNTSGSSETLAPNNPQNWNGSFTYAGSANNLNLGTGAVALGANLQVSVANNMLTSGGNLTGTGYALTKTGAGTLMLTGTSTYTGGTTNRAGLFVLNGGSVNNAASFIVGDTAGSLATLIVSNGATVFTGAASGVGTAANNNTALITGTGSLWNNGGQAFRVGYGFGPNNSNTLVVTSGGALTNISNIYFADNTGGNNNSLVISNGGSLYTSSSANVGQAGGANNNLYQIGGLGAASFATNSSVTVGAAGSSTLNQMVISNATLLTAAASYVGDAAGASSNSITVGAGGLWNLGNAAFRVGAGGLGTNNLMLVTGGGVVTNVNVIYVMDNQAGVGNSLVISNNGQLFDNGGLIVGQAGGANGEQLTVAAGGQLFTKSSSAVGNVNAVNNTATVTGAGSLWNQGGQSFRVGANSSGATPGTNNVLSITSGGVVSNVGSIYLPDYNAGLANGISLANGGQLFSGNITLGQGGGGISNYFNVGGTGASSAATINSLTVGNNAGTLYNQVVVTNATLQCGGNVIVGNNTTSSNNSLSVLTGGILNLAGNALYSEAGVSNNLLISGGVVTNVAGGFIWGNSATALGDTLTISNGGSLFTSSGTTSIGSGSGATGNSVLISGAGSLWNAGGQTVVIGANSGTLNSSLTVAASGLITNGSVTVGGGGSGHSLAVNGATAYVNTLTINSGSGVYLNGGTGDQLFADPVSGSAGITGTAATASSLILGWTGGSQTLTTPIAGSVSLFKSGAGTLTINSAYAYGGNTIISNGVVAFGNNQALSTNLVVMVGGALSNNTAGLVLTNPISLAVASGTVDTTAGNLTLLGSITNLGRLTKAGPNTLTLTGANTYTGGTTVNAGTVSVGSDSNLGTAPGSATAGSIVLNSGTLSASSGFTLTATRGLALGPTSGSGGGTLDVPSGTLTYNGIAANNGGTGSLTKTSAGTLLLGGANTYSGGTTVSAGTLQAGNNAALGTGSSATVASGATLDLNSYSITNTLSLTGSGVGSNGALINSDAGTTSIVTNNILGISFTAGGAGNLALPILDQANSGVFTLTKVGTGTLYLNGTTLNYLMALTVNGGTVVLNKSNGGSSWAVDRGLTINSGTVQLGAAGEQIQTDQGITINGGAFDLGGFSQSINYLTGTGGMVTNSGIAAGTLTVGAVQFGTTTTSSTYAGVISDGNAKVALTKNGTNVFSLTGTNTYSGNTTINAGTLALSGGGSLANTANIVLGGGAVFDVSGLTNAFVLGSSQTLSNSASTAVICGTNSTGSGTVSLMYVSGTPALTVTNGTLTLSAATSFKIRNTGSALAVGSYKIISTNNGVAGPAAAITGTVPPTVTVTGGGIASGATPELTVINGELYLVVDQPVAATMTVTRTAGLRLLIALSDVATNWSNAAGYAPALAGVNLVSTNGVNLQTNSAYILYTNSPNVNDQISYTINDSLGSTNIGYINVVIQSSVTGTNSITGIATGATNVVSAYGIPGYSYILERATNLAPAVWIDVSTNMAATNGAIGVINATDTFWDLGGVPPPSAFYQLKWQP